MPEEGLLPPLAFQGRWRRYQELALEAFERDRQAGRRSTHVLAPPGSGKTVLGMEIVHRAHALGGLRAEVERDAATWRGAAANRRSREIARIKATIKREIARGAHKGVELADLLEPAAHRRVETLRQLGVGTLVLDECHHLASLWGYVVRTVTALHQQDVGTPLSFPEWVITRLRARRTGAEEPELPWASFQRRHPALARAGLRFLASAGLLLPEHAPRGEGYREPPTLGDWLVLLEDYALRCLAPDPSPAAAERHRAIAAALRDLGYRLTRQGIRRAASDVDLLLANSTAKTLALAEVLACEIDVRGARLRALVLCDAE